MNHIGIRRRRSHAIKVGPDGKDIYNEYYRNIQENGMKEVVSISKTIRLG